MNQVSVLLGIVLCCSAAVAPAQTFRPPTANRSLFKVDEQERYFAGTVGKPWSSGTFGCVRSGRSQLHEGIDVRSIRHGKHGEPLDEVMATADGRVAYINAKPSLSNYGNYIVLQHVIDGLEVYSVYAHLSEIRAGLRRGQPVKAGEVIATMGTTSNTRERISNDRAHVHFEINFFVSDRFESWYKKANPKQRNDHGLWNGQNMIGVDPQQLLLLSARDNGGFSFAQWIQNQPELCRVVVRKTNFPWLTRYPKLLVRNPVAEKEGVAGYELSLNFNGLPFKVVPRANSELRSKSKYTLVAVNKAEHDANPCRHLIAQQGHSWVLTTKGLALLDLLTY